MAKLSARQLHYNTLRDFYSKKEAEAEVMKKNAEVNEQKYDTVYEHNSTAKDSIFAMFEVVMGEFAKTISEVQMEETTSEQEYENFVNNSNV